MCQYRTKHKALSQRGRMTQAHMAHMMMGSSHQEARLLSRQGTQHTTQMTGRAQRCIAPPRRVYNHSRCLSPAHQVPCLRDRVCSETRQTMARTIQESRADTQRHRPVQ